MEQGIKQSVGYETYVPPAPEQPSFGEKVEVAHEEFTAIGGILRGAAEEDFSVQADKDYWKTDDKLKSEWYLEGLSTPSQEYVAEARSDEEAEFRRSRAQEWDANQQVIQESGFTGMLLPTVVAAIGDPLTWVAGIGEVKALASFAKVGFAKKAGVGFGIGAAYEMPQYATNIHTDASDVVLAAAVGGLLSGVLPIGTTGKSVSDTEVKDQLATRQPYIQSFQDSSAGAQQVRDSIVERSDATMSEEDILGGVAARNTELDSTSTAKEGAVTRTASKIFGVIDFSITGGFKKSAKEGNPVSELISKDILSDASGENTRGLSAADLQHGYSFKFTEKTVLQYGDIADEWVGRNHNVMAMESSVGAPRFQKAMAEFDDMVYSHMNQRFKNHDKPGYSDWLSKQDESVVKAADKLDEGYIEMLQARKDSGEVGFKTIEHTPGYLPRIMDSTAIQNSRTNAGAYQQIIGEEIERLSKSRHNAKLDKLTTEVEELKRQAKDLDDDVLKEASNKKIAKAVEAIAKVEAKMANMDTTKFKTAGRDFYDNLVRTGLGLQKSVDDIFRTADLDTLTEMVGDPAVAKELFDNFQDAMSEASKSSRAKNRIGFDMDKTSLDGKFKLSDLYSKNIRVVSSRYGRETAGTVALARKGIKSQHQWRELAKVGAVQEKGGGEKYMQTMDDVYNMMLSRPISGAMGRGTRRLNEYTNLIMLGRTGIAQLADMAMMTASNGFMNVVKSSREYAKIRKKINAGEAEDSLLGQLATLGGRIGDDHILFSPTLDRIGEATDAGVVSKGWEKYDEYSGSLSASLFYLNGMNHIKRFQQRVATIASTHTVVSNILNGKNLERLSSVGFDEKLISAVKKEHAAGNIVLDAKGGVEDLNLKGWSNLGEAQDFAFAIRKAVTTQVQDPLVGEGIMAMNRDIGSLMLKLMAFPILAMQKQMSRSAQHHDMTSLALAGYGTMMGMAVFTLNKELGAIGSEKSGDVWADLQDDPSKIFMGSMMYNPLVGILPDFANLGAAMGLVPQEWSPSGAMRGSEGFSGGPNMEAIAGATPSTQTILAPLRALSLIPRSIVEGEAPDRAANDIQAAVPLGNTLFLGTLFNQLKE